MKRGSIHWGETQKRRPLIILSPERRNLFASDVLVIPCSTSARRMSWHVPLGRGEAGLPQACFAACEQIGVLSKELVDPEELGLLSPARMREVELALISALGIQD